MTDDVWVVAMPKLGETVTEGTVGSWLKQVGDTVAFDDPLFEVSTDKVDSEIPSPYDGVIQEILVPAGETVAVGTPLVRIGTAGVAAQADPPTVGGSEGPATVPAEAGFPASAAPDASGNGSGGGGEVFEVTMPKLGETVTEGTVGSWLKRVGDTVAFDDPLFEVSTDKVDSEIPSPYDGVVLEVLVAEGETVPVGTVLVRIGDPSASRAAAPAPVQTLPGAEPAASVSPTTEAKPGSANGGGRMLSPVVRRLAAEKGVDLSLLSGTGAGGRIRREDVERAIAADRGGAQALVAAPGAPPTAAPAPAAPAPAAPAPAGPAPSPTSAPQLAGAPTAAPAGQTDPRDQVVPLSRMRLTVADLMVKSLNTSAHVWTSVEVDFHHIDQVRAKHKASFKADTGASLTYLPFVARAVCEALRAHPAVNASIDVKAKTMTMHPYVNLGVAVDLDEQGLVVPVVRDADSMNIRGLARTITTMASAARSKKLSMADMSGSTFTITNPGPFASYASSPVINQPNVAILCTDGVTRRPVAVGDAIAIHPMGIIGLVYDHRAFDGSTASKFLLDLRNLLQDRDWAAEVQ
ncbi:MAG TPA: 2-oxoglutarate dehydrogenase, E2 component, dihydrolipoamide succinyltransferase [Actinomycetales bacterium]|nr:2-oxoglutarate dehydrogenase, E2 component, dihydrolipoamide succinyltransferase [Actinomycetales bacterium]